MHTVDAFNWFSAFLLSLFRACLIFSSVSGADDAFPVCERNEKKKRREERKKRAADFIAFVGSNKTLYLEILKCIFIASCLPGYTIKIHPRSKSTRSKSTRVQNPPDFKNYFLYLLINFKIFLKFFYFIFIYFLLSLIPLTLTLDR